MCKIIYIKNKNKISRNKLMEYYRFNNDGIGIAYKKDNKVKVVKFSNFESFYNFYKKIKYDKIIMHFRAATKGLVNCINTHPFLITKDIRRFIEFCNLEYNEEFVLDENEYLLFHNGHFNEIDEKYDFMSKIFDVDLLKELKINKELVSDTFLAAFMINVLFWLGKEISKAINIFLEREKHDRIIIIDNNFNIIYKSGSWIDLNKNIEVSNGLGDFYYYSYYYEYENNEKANKKNKFSRKKRFFGIF